MNKEQKVYYINSYHQGYSSSDDIMEGIMDVLSGKADYQVFFMDTKRKNDTSFIKSQVSQILHEIDKYDPDIIIASDDNAVKYVIEPYFKYHDIPVVFCGVNWSATQYGLPTNSVTGMLEILPIKETVNIVQESYPTFKTLTVLSENTISEQKNMEIIQTLFEELDIEISYVLADDFETWKSAFALANEASDIIFLPTNGAIKNWKDSEAREFIANNIRKPVITCDDFMMPYTVFGLTKVAKEQGEWAAETSLKILNGAEPNIFPVTTNSTFRYWLNQSLAKKIGYFPSDEIHKKCEIIK